MIEIEKANKWRHCNCCNSAKDVRELTFRSDNHGISISLCGACMEELRTKVMGTNISSYIRLPSHGGKIDVKFKPKAMMGTISSGDETVQVYLSNMTVESFSCGPDLACAKRKYILVEI